jgi:hypothetical protein
VRVGSTAELANDFVVALERPQVGVGLSIDHTFWSARSMPRVAHARDAWQAVTSVTGGRHFRPLNFASAARYIVA